MASQIKDCEKIVGLLQRIRGPIAYACQDSFSRLSTVKNLGSFVTQQIQGSLFEGSPQDSLGQELQALITLFVDYDSQPFPECKDRLRKACTIMKRLDQEARNTLELTIKDSNPIKQQQKVKSNGPLKFKEKPDSTLPVVVLDAGGRGSSRVKNGSIPWEMDIQYVEGVGAKRADCFRRLGLKTLEDLLYFLPWRYEDRGNLKKIDQMVLGEEFTLSVQILSTRLHLTLRKRLQIFEIMARDETGWLVVKWFNQPYLKKILKKGQWLMLSGKVKANPYDGRLVMENPQFEVISQDLERIESTEELIHTGRIVPIYHETRGLTSRVIRSLMKTLLDTWSECISEMLPQPILDRYKLPRLDQSLQQVHFPDRTQHPATLNQGRSEFHRRLVFDDFFLLQLGLAYKRREVIEEKRGIAFSTEGARLDHFLSQLPFSLTAAQKRVIVEIKQDMARPRPMNRLVQGDVGCGKTLIALVAFIIAIENGYQGVFMAPTEILAEQHYLTVKRWVSNLGLKTVLVTSGLSRKEREVVERQIQSGEANLAVGTHALIQEGVRFKQLGLVIIDEQHKFGVLQRGELVKKGDHPDVLIMTATPIPRTLALTAYGDMDVSVIDELPPGRSPVETVLLEESERERGYDLVVKELSAGRQAYVVYPLVEESQKTDLKAAIQMERSLREEVFQGWRVGLLHGQMKTEEKEKVMFLFKDRQVDLLVATSVIEVGIDVPNATVVWIEHAERFGLAQLHQLRGRVGRGSQRSICLLMAGTRLTREARHRLEVMVQSQDGFTIAEEDLILRGPGEFFGTRQAGLPELKVANLIRDAGVLELARSEAFRLLEQDPLLLQPEHQGLRHALHRRWKDKLELMTIS